MGLMFFLGMPLLPPRAKNERVGLGRRGEAVEDEGHGL